MRICTCAHEEDRHVKDGPCKAAVCDCLKFLENPEAGPLTDRELVDIEARIARGYDGIHCDEETLITEDAPRLVAEVRRLRPLSDRCEEALRASTDLLQERAVEAGELLAEVERLRRCVQDLEDVNPLQEELDRATDKADRLANLINNPHTNDFLKAVRLEAAHQRERWPNEYDVVKTDQDWFWVLGYLAGKAIRPGQDQEKRLHHIITSAAVCLNWHRLAKEWRHPPAAPGVEA